MKHCDNICCNQLRRYCCFVLNSEVYEFESTEPWRPNFRNSAVNFTFIPEDMIMTMNDLLLGLPESLFCSVMSQWVDIEHVFKVDSAYCHRNKRAALHDMFRSKEMMLSNRTHCRPGLGYPKRFYEWCTVRKLKFFEFFLPADIPTGMKPDNILNFIACSSKTLVRFECCSDYCPTAWVEGLARHCAQMSTIDLFTCFESVHGTTLAVLLTNNQNTLKRLVLRVNRIVSPVPCNFTLPVLEELVLDVKHDVEGGLDVKYLLQAATNIRTLSIYTNSTSVAVLEVLRNCPSHTNLATISFFGLAEASAELLPSVCPTGPALELYFVNEVSSEAFNHCVLNCQNIQLIDCTIDNNLLAIGSCGGTLRKLSFRRSDLPGFDPVDVIATVRQCTSLTDFSFCSTSLALTCYDVEEIVIALAPSVHSLTLCDMPIENCVLQAIGERMPQLTDLRISFAEDGIERYNEEGVFYILKGCPKLRNFGVGGVPETIISPMALFLWRKMSPELNLFDGSEDYFSGYDQEYDINDMF